MRDATTVMARRVADAAFSNRYIVGQGLDLSAGPGSRPDYGSVFPRVSAVQTVGFGDADLQLLPGIANDSLDFVDARYSLQRVPDPRIALANWLRVVRPGGHVVILVPDEDALGRAHWANRASNGDRWTLTACKRDSWSPCSISIVDLVSELADCAELERLAVLRGSASSGTCDTSGPGDEIELVLRRRAAPIHDAILHGATSRNLVPPLGELRVKACSQGVLAFDPRSGGPGRLLDRYGEYAEGQAALLERLLRRGDVVVSAAAGMGVLPVHAARRVGPRGAVHAFEPDDEAHRLLVTNATLNDLPQLRCRQVSLDDGTGLTVDQLSLPNCRLVMAGPSTTVSALLRGARGTIERCQPFLLLAVAGPGTVPAIRSGLNAQGYQAFWHVVPAVRDPNFYGRAVEAADRDRLVALLGAPVGLTIVGLAPVLSDDWLQDLRRAAQASASSRSQGS